MQEAIEALKAGNRARAFTLLRQYLVANPKDANGWAWMSEVAPEPSQQIDALQRVLLLAPDHPHAPAIRERLRELHASTQPLPAILDMPPSLRDKAVSSSSTLNDIDVLLARLRGERDGEPEGKVAPPQVPSGGGRSHRGNSLYTTAQQEQEVEQLLGETPATIAAARQRKHVLASGVRGSAGSVTSDEDHHSVAVAPRGPEDYFSEVERHFRENETAEPVEQKAGPRKATPVPRWFWGVLLFLILVVASLIFVVLSARQALF